MRVRVWVEVNVHARLEVYNCHIDCLLNQINFNLVPATSVLMLTLALTSSLTLTLTTTYVHEAVRPSVCPSRENSLQPSLQSLL